MGLLEKLGLVEEQKEPQESSQIVNTSYKESNELYNSFDIELNDRDFETETDANSYTVNTGNTDSDCIKEIYSASGKSDLSRSIFKVGELMDSLPNTLPTAVKKESVLSIIKSFNLSVDALTSDADSRVAMLSSGLQDIDEQLTSKIKGSEAEIENLKIKIAELEAQVKVDSDKLSDNTIEIQSEIKKIKDLVTFITA